MKGKCKSKLLNRAKRSEEKRMCFGSRRTGRRRLSNPNRTNSIDSTLQSV